jgi:SpoVK/Ycf46/Vps4 family AAA+-type ATPase
VSRINVIVAYTSPDLVATLIAPMVSATGDMQLINHEPVPAAEVDALLASLPPSPQCAVIVVGEATDAMQQAARWRRSRADLVVLLVEIVGDTVRIALGNPPLESLLTVLRSLADRAKVEGEERLVRVQVQPVRPPQVSGDEDLDPPAVSPLLRAAAAWVHHVLRDAVQRAPVDPEDVKGLSVTRATLLQSLDAMPERAPEGRPAADLIAAEAALDEALADSDPNTVPLAAVARDWVLSVPEFRLLLLALAPELDYRFQLCLGFLLDDISRRVGTLALYSGLLGSTLRIRHEVTYAGALERWGVFEDAAGNSMAADEALRVDPFLARWLLGEGRALERDPRVRRALRFDKWLGASLLRGHEERAQALRLLTEIADPSPIRWLVLGGADPAGWRALVELGASVRRVTPLRIELARLKALDVVDLEAAGRRIGRLARLTRRPLIVDVIKAESVGDDDDWLRVFFTALGSTRARAALICADAPRLIGFLGSVFELRDEAPLSADARLAAVRLAAGEVEVFLTGAEVRAFSTRYPLHIDALEQALHLAHSRPLDYTSDDPRLARFTAALKELVAEGLSHLADRLDPVFDLDDVVLPADRRSQLNEIVDNVELAHYVLDEWKFGARLPFGRGVTALFCGPSGTGKTTAAMGIARRLNIQILRLDLSRVVSKYIGDTEKNIDRVFSDAERSGAAILIDEADALLGKRSEVKDAHDRYANIEVAFLLQRMEAFSGLAILTTNMRQGLDAAFLRRLRFIVDFPRPDAAAREKIWRLCLPAGSHTLDDAAFRLLGRKVDLAGGNIRQITLRAAFIAAAAGSQITLAHVGQAIRAELTKLGLPSVDLDFAQGREAA